MKVSFFMTMLVTVLLLTISATQAPSFDSRFSKVNPGEGVTGTVGESYLFISLEECVVRCSGSGECKALEYNGILPGNCLLINQNYTSGDGTIFMSNTSNLIYLKVYSSGSIPDPDGWKQPIGWFGSGPVLYWSLDNLDGLVLMEGTQQKDYDALTDGKVKSALNLTHTKNQWVDLGIQPDACLVVPDSCGPEGAAVAFWVKLYACAEGNGIISSFSFGRTGFMICCASNARILFYIFLTEVGSYKHISRVEDQWIHLVLNFIREGEELQIFKDGALISARESEKIARRSPGDGRLVLGRRYTHRDQDYATIDLDELVFFNRKLTAQEVAKIYEKDK